MVPLNLLKKGRISTIYLVVVLKMLHVIKTELKISCAGENKGDDVEIIKLCKPEEIKKIRGRASFNYLMAVDHKKSGIFNFTKKKPFQKKAKIIALEGLNCCGKTTQKHLLEEQLRQGKYSVSIVPTYETPCWEIMSKIGKGTFYINKPIEDTVIWATYFIDQVYNVKKELEENDFVIFDRYKDNYRFIQQAIMEFYKINFSKEWLEDLVSELPEPDYAIFIDISSKEMKKRYEKRGGRVPLEVTDLEISEKARELFIHKYLLNKSQIVDGTLSPHEISKNIYKYIKNNGG